MAIKPRVYLDSCCFIDAVKHDAGILPKERENDVWFIKKIFEAHRAGILIAHTSLVAVGECLAIEKGQVDVPEIAKDRFKSLLTSGQYVQLLSPTPETARWIQRFRWDHNLVLGAVDAIHFACAIERGCTEFITMDGRIKSTKVAAAIPSLNSLGLRVIVAPKTAFLPSSFTQGKLDDTQGP